MSEIDIYIVNKILLNKRWDIMVKKQVVDIDFYRDDTYQYR